MIVKLTYVGVEFEIQSFLSEEGCHWFNVGFSQDVFILDVVLLCLASSPSRHSHLCGVHLLGIFFLPAFM